MDGAGLEIVKSGMQDQVGLVLSRPHALVSPKIAEWATILVLGGPSPESLGTLEAGRILAERRRDPKGTHWWVGPGVTGIFRPQARVHVTAVTVFVESMVRIAPFPGTILPIREFPLLLQPDEKITFSFQERLISAPFFVDAQ